MTSTGDAEARGRPAGDPNPPDSLRVRRYPGRGRYDRPTIDAILDAGLVCHLGFVVGGRPVVLPTLYWRDGDWLCWHGSAASSALGASEGAEVCLTVSHLDGLVLTRSAFNHSANYRSVAVFGRAERAPAEETLGRMRGLVDGLFPDRWDSLRPVTARELKATRILRLPLERASAKVRNGGPDDALGDLDWPAWSGVLPISLAFGAAQPDKRAAADGLSAPPAPPRLLSPQPTETVVAPAESSARSTPAPEGVP